MPDTGCPPEHELLGALAAPAASELARHVAACPDCRQRLARLESGVSTLRRSIGPSRGSALPPPSTSGGPRFLGKYFIAGAARQHDWGQTLRGAHGLLHTDVLIHLLGSRLPADPAAQRPIIETGRLLMTLDHPALARVLDLDFFEGRPYLVCEHATGADLTRHVGQRGLGRREAVWLVAEVAGAVGAVHRHGVVHGFVEPHNVVVDDQGQPRLLGAGVWVLVAQARRAAGEDAGADGSATDATRASDMRALGRMLVLCLAGRGLSDDSATADQASATAEAVLRDVPVPRRLRRLCAEAIMATAAGPDAVDRWAAAVRGSARPRGLWLACWAVVAGAGWAALTWATIQLLGSR